MAGIEGDVWKQEYDHSQDPKREPGPIELSRYVINSHAHAGIGTFMGAPVCITPEDLKAGKVDAAVNDDFLFNQGPTRGLGKIQFHDYNIAYNSRDTKNLQVFREQIEAFKAMLMAAPPNKDQQKDIDFLLAGGEIFALVVYGQLILENAELSEVGEPVVEQIFDVLVRDFAAGATRLHGKATTSDKQAAFALQMVQRPHVDPDRFAAVWDEALALIDTYELAP